MIRRSGWVAVCAVLAAGCTSNEEQTDTAAPPQSETQTGVAAVSAAELPSEVVAAATAAIPGLKIESAERKERNGRVYYDVEGTRPDGSEVELDLLNDVGEYKVVEIQRDIAWADAPAAARTAAAASPKAFEPVRVIESTQTDGSVVYELFAEGAPSRPALEVRMTDGKAEVLQEEWMH